MKQNKRRINRTKRFQPDREFIRQAVEEYLKRGGRIEKQEFVERPEYDCSSEVDDFLNGRWV